MSAIQAIFFDQDDTLIDDTLSFKRSIELVCRDFHPLFDSKRLMAEYGGRTIAFWPAGDLRKMRLELWRGALGACGYDPSLAEKVLDSYMHHRSETCEALDGAVETLEALDGRYALAVITNGGSDLQSARLERAGLAGYFRLLVASSDIDAGKPDAAIFEHAMRCLDVEACRTWHVGDSLTSDVGGARNAGLTAVWFNPHCIDRAVGGPEPHHEIRSLTELLDLLP